ncbi:MAG: FAD-dependent oxidoreductase, partial [Myxococcales bacterium]|nr:FAD-dependent oxidoreductase [Myxococcales bacterium]
NVDSDVDLQSVDLDRLVAPLVAGDAAATWAPFVERAGDTLGDRASRALLCSSLQSFVVLCGLDQRSLVGKCFAVRVDALRSAGGFEALSRHLGEDVELARRLREQGHSVRAVAVRPISRASGRDFAAVVRRYARWLAVVRAQRPWLMVSYPLLLFATLPLCACALLLAARGDVRWWQAAAAAGVALGARALVGLGARRVAGAQRGSLAYDVLLSDVLLALAWARALISRRINWRGRWQRVEPGGILAPDRRPALLALRRLLARGIERALGGYRQPIVEIDTSLPLARSGDGKPRRVAVIGGGIAGITAASTLAQRGMAVTLLEKNEHLGGKIGAWRERLVDDEGVAHEVDMEHGFHAFFRHYYNLDAFLSRLGLRQSMKSIGDYVIIERGGEQIGFAELDTAPLLNMFSMARAGIFSWRDVLESRPTLDNMDAFLRYDPVATPAAYDGVSFAEFADKARLPRRLRLAFSTFARAFFADEQRMSMAELIKSFHFYYLSNDAGLIYDYPDDDYERALLRPLREHLAQVGVTLRLGAGVGVIAPASDDGGDDALLVDGERFDDVVLACDVVGARAIAEGSSALAGRYPRALAALRALRPSQRYAVLRVFSDAELPADMPLFVITEREQVLDAVAVVSRVNGSAQRWSERHGGCVYELHCYAVPDGLDEREVRDGLLAEAERALPALRGQRVRLEHLQLNANFAAFHVGMASARPGVETDVPGLFLAGDWVALPRPAMLMEAACMSGLLAANGVLARTGLRREQVYAVPARGLMASWPMPPKRYPVVALAKEARQRPLAKAR